MPAKAPWRWPFEVGDHVTARGNWGPLVTDLLVHSENNPGAVYTILEVHGEGRWLLVLRAEDGRLFRGGYGHTYFRIAGKCGNHWRSYSSELGWHCARCDMPMGIYL